jgi:hypothetical protein
MDQRTLSALSHLSRGYDMVQVYKDVWLQWQELWSANAVGTQYTKHLRRSIRYAYNRECGWGIKED